MSDVASTREMMWQTKAIQAATIQRIIDGVNNVKEIIKQSGRQIASGSEDEIYTALIDIANSIGGVKSAPEAKRAQAAFKISIDHIGECLEYPDLFHDLQEWRDCFALDCKVAFRYLFALLLVMTPAEAEIFRATAINAFGYKALVLDTDIETGTNPNQPAPKKGEEQQAEEPKKSRWKK